MHSLRVVCVCVSVMDELTSRAKHNNFALNSAHFIGNQLLLDMAVSYYCLLFTHVKRFCMLLLLLMFLIPMLFVVVKVRNATLLLLLLLLLLLHNKLYNWGDGSDRGTRNGMNNALGLLFVVYQSACCTYK